LYLHPTSGHTLVASSFLRQFFFPKKIPAPSTSFNNIVQLKVNLKTLYETTIFSISQYSQYNARFSFSTFDKIEADHILEA